MIDIQYAKDNINKYKFDYLGYLVIVDNIRTKEVIEENKTKNMKFHLDYLLKKYKNELDIINSNIERKMLNKDINKLSKQTIIKKLEYFIEILPAIGFISLGLQKEIGINSIPINSQFSKNVSKT